MSFKILTLTGPSGVGKGFVKSAIKNAFPGKFDEPVIVTTRDKRESDGVDRLAGLTLSDFFQMQEKDELLFSHQPFGKDGDWYAFYRKSLVNSAKHIITEVHVDNLRPFRKMFPNALMFALVAEDEYLYFNLMHRKTESDIKLQKRLDTAILERMNVMKKRNMFMQVFEIGFYNRDFFVQDLINLLCSSL